MDSDSLRKRITDQFSYRGDRSDVWRGFDLLLDTDAFLNLGYSKWYQPHVVGSSQRRLATVVGRKLASRLPTTDGVGLLDVGCGRGGPTVHLADRFGFRATGIDLVPYNVARARENAAGRDATERDLEVEFVVGDAMRLPFAPGSFTACVAIDSLVYLPERNAVVSGLADVLEPGGLVVVSDLVVRPGADDAERRAVASFADAWDMPPPATVPEYERALDESGLDVREVEDVTPNSVGRFRKWTTLYRLLTASPAGVALERLLERRGLDPAAIDEQIRRAHDALPSLRHVVLVAEK